MLVGQFLGFNVKESIFPKCSESESVVWLQVGYIDVRQITRTFVRDDKGVWKCTKCNYKLGRDKKVFPFRMRPPAMVMKVADKQTSFNTNPE